MGTLNNQVFFNPLWSPDPALIQQVTDEMRAIIIRNHPVFYHLILSLCLIQVKILFLLTTPTKSWWGRPRFHSRSPTNLMSPVRPMLRWTPRLCCSSKLILQIQGQQNRLIWLFNGFLNVPFFFVSFFSAPRGSLWMWSGSSLGRLWLRSWTHQQAQNRSEIRFRANKVTWVVDWCVTKPEPVALSTLHISCGQKTAWLLYGTKQEEAALLPFQAGLKATARQWSVNWILKNNNLRPPLLRQRPLSNRSSCVYRKWGILNNIITNDTIKIPHRCVTTNICLHHSRIYLL